ncbi:MAG TPA: PorV/PorQ family protein, partial [Prolixibacteraceae bacterium]
MKMKILLYKILILVLLINIVLSAQAFNSDVSKKGTTAAPFLSIGQGAKSVAMGSAFVGVADDPSTIYWNPAGLAKLTGVGLVFDHTQWIASVGYNFVAASYSLGEMGTLGFSFTGSDIGDMNVTTIDVPNGTGEVFNASDNSFSLAYAINLTDNFAFGISPKFIYQKIWKMDASAFALDMGVTYRTPFDGMILAMSISNFGTKMQMLGNSDVVLYDPNLGSTGNNGKIPATIQTGLWSLPLTFRVGVAYSPVNTENHKVTLAVDAMHPVI